MIVRGLKQYFNKSKVTRAIHTLEDYKDKGLEDFETGQIVVSPDKVQTAIEMFEQNRKGNYYCNIIDYPWFSTKEAAVILTYVGNVTYEFEE